MKTLEYPEGHHSKTEKAKPAEEAKTSVKDLERTYKRKEQENQNKLFGEQKDFKAQTMRDKKKSSNAIDT